MHSSETTHSQQLRVLFDLSVLGAGRVHPRARTGVYRVVDFLAHYLTQQSDLQVTWSAFGNPDHLQDAMKAITDDPALQRPFEYSPLKRSLAATVRWPVNRLAASHLYRLVKPLIPLSDRLKQTGMICSGASNRYDVVHSPFHPLPRPDQLPDGPVRFLTVYDLIPIKYPHWFDDGIYQRHCTTLAQLTSRDWVLCISECTRQDLLNYRPDLNPDHVLVTPLAAPAHFQPVDDLQCRSEMRTRFGIPQSARYFLSVCTLEPRKNLAFLLDAFLSIKDALGDCYLVLVGATGWQIEELLDKLKQQGQNRVIVTGFVADEKLAPLYSDAMAFVYPSLYEGFGLPPLEAMQCGVPVITSNVSSLPEVVGDAGLMVSPHSVDELAAAMLSVADDGQLCSQLAAKGLKRAKLFSWQRCGEATVAAYQLASSQQSQHRTRSRAPKP